MSLPVDERVPALRWGYGLMAGFIALLAAVTGHVAWDRQHRALLETVTEPTAVGDPVSVAYDPRQSPAKEILKWQGQPYYLSTNEALKLPEVEARKLARDDGGTIQLYRSKGGTDDRIVLVKLNRDTFLRLTKR